MHPAAPRAHAVCRRTGWRVRLFSQYDADAVPGSPGPRQLWGSLDRKTVVVKARSTDTQCSRA